MIRYGTDREQRYSQVLTLHSKGRSPVCIIMWRLRMLGRGHTFPQCSHDSPQSPDRAALAPPSVVTDAPRTRELPALLLALPVTLLAPAPPRGKSDASAAETRRKYHELSHSENIKGNLDSEARCINQGTQRHTPITAAYVCLKKQNYESGMCQPPAASYVTPQHGVLYYITVRGDDRPNDPPPAA